jgi:hypothetical protein
MQQFACADLLSDVSLPFFPIPAVCCLKTRLEVGNIVHAPASQKRVGNDGDDARRSSRAWSSRPCRPTSIEHAKIRDTSYWLTRLSCPFSRASDAKFDPAFSVPADGWDAGMHGGGRALSDG